MTTPIKVVIVAWWLLVAWVFLSVWLEPPDPTPVTKLDLVGRWIVSALALACAWATAEWMTERSDDGESR